MQVNSEPTTQDSPTRPPRPATEGTLPGSAVGRGATSQNTAGLSAGDAEKAAALRKMKMVALGLLIAMAVIFVFAFALQKEYPWLQYVRAAAEGGMVGALADWFARS